MNTTYQEEILADLKRAEKFDLDDPLFMLERIKKYDFGYFYHKKNGINDRFDPDYYEYEAFSESRKLDFFLCPLSDSPIKSFWRACMSLKL